MSDLRIVSASSRPAAMHELFELWPSSNWKAGFTIAAEVFEIALRELFCNEFKLEL